MRKYQLIVIFSVLAFSCTDAGLKSIIDRSVEYVDDKFAVSGEFCSSPADEVPFPVKLLIVIDQSASLQCTDPANNRLTALNSAGRDLDSLPNVEFGVVGFAAWSKIVDFTPNWNEARDALAPEGGAGGPATDYQGALATALRVLEQDMVKSGPAEVSRSKYIVVFVSDGIPEPRCRLGCDDGDSTPDSLYGVCNTDQEIPDDIYVDMKSVCPDYNQPEQILQKVQDIRSLSEFYGVGDLSFHSILLFTTPEAVAAACGDVTQFGYVREEALPLLRQMAQEGGGTFRDVNISTEIDFLDFDYESLQAPYRPAEFFAININSVRNKNGFAIDSDGDGIDDDTEFDLGLNRLVKDTDGDNYGDYLEYIYSDRGFDPKDKNIPAMECTARQDRDGDGLLECEEAFLKTDPLLPDTDGDRIPDGLELRFGLDPTIKDTLVDHDFDGLLSGQEIRSGTAPLLFDEDGTYGERVLYSLEKKNVSGDEITCYDFSVQGLTLVPTMKQTTSEVAGTNRILIFAEEEPESSAGQRGRFHVACVEARYLGDTYKDPPSGLISGLHRDHFVEVQIFNPEEHCLRLGDDPAAPPGGGE